MEQQSHDATSASRATDPSKGTSGGTPTERFEVLQFDDWKTDAEVKIPKQGIKVLEDEWRIDIDYNYEVTDTWPGLPTSSTLEEWGNDFESGCDNLSATQLAYLEDDERYSLGISAEPGPSASHLPIKRQPVTSSYALSKEGASLIRRWVATCKGDCHPEQFPPLLPTRLVDIGDLDDGVKCPRLVLTPQGNLSVEQGCVWKYVALSHCWGDPSAPPLKTVKNSIAQMMEAIPKDDLPKNFRDAIAATQALGVRYLWIDSLCIIQDDHKDWEKESARMCDTYRYADVTICAATGNSCHDGFLQRRRRDMRSSLPNYGAHNRSSYRKFFRNSTGWGSRGWTLQESLMSTRRLVFNPNLMYLECGSYTLREDALIEKRHGSWIDATLKGSDEAIEDVLDRVWYLHASEYSSRRLTHVEDKLPAISALAKMVAEGTGAKYLAGLWKEDLIRGLNWHLDNDNPLSLEDYLADVMHPTKFIAPSWSWACHDRFVKWRYEPSQQVSAECNIVAAETTVDGMNPFGRIHAGFILLDAKVCPVPRLGLSESYIRRRNQVHMKMENVNIGGCFLDFEIPDDLVDPDNFVDLKPGGPMEGLQMMVLSSSVSTFGSLSFFSPLQNTRWNGGLLLLPSGRESEFRRVGIFHGNRTIGEEKNWLLELFEKLEKRRIRII